jgi:proton-translocating NADH-quinone oxidoreductase chain N
MKDFLSILPELIIALTMGFVLFGEITYYGEKTRLITATAVIGLAGALLETLIGYREGASQVFYGAVSVDGLSLFFKLLFTVLAALAILASSQSDEIAPKRRSEYIALILGSTFSMCLAADSAELLLSFLALQSVNVLAYFIAGYGKSSIRSTESAVKFMVFSAVSGACFLYGTGVLFAATHSLNIYEIHKALIVNPLSRIEMLVVFMLFVISIGFQIAAFPMSLWAPDVLEGSPTPSSGFLSVGVRSAGFAVAIRLFVATFTQAGGAPGEWKILGEVDWTQILSLLSGLTMGFGAFLAFRQTSAKRMVGCLVVAQSGYLLMGLLVLDEVGIAALLFNLLIDLFSLVGIYYVLSFLFDRLGSDQMKDYRGMLIKAVPECISLVLFLLCLVGIPPMPGFLGKFTLIGVVIRHNQLALAAAAIFSMALSTVAISRLAYSLVGGFRLPTSSVGDEFKSGGDFTTNAEVSVSSSRRNAFLASLLIPMIVVGVFAEFFLNWAGRSLGFIFW